MKLRALRCWPAFSCSLLFFILGYPFLRYPGLQNDEVVFAGPLCWTSGFLYGFDIFHHRVPVMLANYYGALKSWLYAPVLHYSQSYASIRVPALLIGSLSVFFFFLLVERLHSRRAAWMATLLLSTDAVYLLTTCFDWGPVTLQHLFLVLGLLLAVLFTETGS